MFTTFCYEEEINTKDFAACYPFHHEQMLVPIIDIVDDEFTRYCTHMNMRLDKLVEEGDTDAHRVLSSHMNMVVSAQGIITTGNLAKLLLQCTDTFRAKKNSPIKGWGGLSKMSNKMSINELSRLGQDLFDFSGLT